MTGRKSSFVKFLCPNRLGSSRCCSVTKNTVPDNCKTCDPHRLFSCLFFVVGYSKNKNNNNNKQTKKTTSTNNFKFPNKSPFWPWDRVHVVYFYIFCVSVWCCGKQQIWMRELCVCVCVRVCVCVCGRQWVFWLHVDTKISFFVGSYLVCIQEAKAQQRKLWAFCVVLRAKVSLFFSPSSIVSVSWSLIWRDPLCFCWEATYFFLMLLRMVQFIHNQGPHRFMISRLL